MLQKFFSEHFSKAIEQNIVRRIYNESDGAMDPESDDRIDTTQINKKIRSFHFIESISEHVAGIYALFFHPNFYTFHTEQMTTILHSCYVENAPHRHSTENEEEESQHNLDIQLSV